jgi:hypothetical protein
MSNGEVSVLPEPDPSTPTPNPAAKKDPEILRLEKDLERAKLQAQIAEQRKLALPTIDAKSLSGETRGIEGDIIETEILAYRMVRKAAETIAKNAHDATKEGAILIHHEPDMNALIAFRSFQRQLSQLAASFDAIARSSAPSALETLAIPGGIADAVSAILPIAGVVAAGAGSVLSGLATFLSTERTVAGFAVTIEDLALISNVGGELAQRKRKVFVTQLYPRSADIDRVQEPVNLVRSSALEARDRISALPDGDEKTKAQARFDQLEETRKTFEDLFERIVSDGGSGVITLVRGAGIDALLSAEPGAHVLYLKILRAAGTNETKRSFLRTKVRRSGGVVVNYILFDTDGSILLSNTVDAYSGKVDELVAT